MARSPRSRRLLSLELLEDRSVPAVITVTSLDDNTDTDGAVTLREALQAAETDSSVDGSTAGDGADTIEFAASLFASGDRTLSLSAPPVNDSTSFGPSAFVVASEVSVVGPSGNNGLTVERDSGAVAFRLFTVTNAGKLTLKYLTLTGGLAQGGDGGDATGFGGQSSTSNNRPGGGGGAGLGGAVFNAGTLTLDSVTLVANTAQGGDGARAGGTSTNTGAGGGGGGLGGAASGSTGGANGGADGTSDTGTNNLAARSGGFGGGGGAGRGGAASVGGSGGFGGGGAGSGKSTAPSTGPAGGVAGFGGGKGGGAKGTTGVSGSDAHGGGGGGAGLGGAVFNMNGTVNIVNSTFANNSALGGASGIDSGSDASSPPEAGSGHGGGLFNLNGTVTVTNSTFSGNVAQDGASTPNDGFGGAIYALAHETGAGVTAADVTLTLTNAILANSDAQQDLWMESRDGFGGGTVTVTYTTSIVESRANLEGTADENGTPDETDPALGSLADNGGPTKTFLPDSGSAAIGSGTATGAPRLDQRGETRGGTVDIGSVQVTEAGISAGSDTLTVNENGPAQAVDVLSNDSPDTHITQVAGEDIATGQTVTLQSGATVTLLANGTLRYNPNGKFESLGTGDIGSDGFQYTISAQASDTDSITLWDDFLDSDMANDLGTGHASDGVPLVGADADQANSEKGTDALTAVVEQVYVIVGRGKDPGTTVDPDDDDGDSFNFTVAAGHEFDFRLEGTSGSESQFKWLYDAHDFGGSASTQFTSQPLEVTGLAAGDYSARMFYGGTGFWKATITVRNTGGSSGSPQTATGSVSVSVTGANDAPTVTPNTFTPNENLANGSVVGTVTANDAEGQTLQFAITNGNQSGAFAINPTTGVVTVADSSKLDFETTPTFVLTVQATDNDGTPASGTATITINLNDVNEPTTPPPGTVDLPAQQPLLLPGTADTFFEMPPAPDGAPPAVAVHNLYQSILGRLADPSGLANFQAMLTFGVSAQEVARIIWNSQEHREQQVRELYLAIFGREADAAGLAGWTGQLLAGQSEEWVAEQLLNSAEFSADLSPAEVVQKLYNVLLGRVASEAEIQSQLAASGGNLLAVVHSVLYSDEARVRLIDGLFEGYLNREAEAPAVESLLAFTKSPAYSLFGLVSSILTSAEFGVKADARDPLGVL
jgi:hypothetical protein